MKIRNTITLILLALGLLMSSIVFAPGIPQRLVRLLIVREKVVSSDAIVILLGGVAMERAELARTLYRQGAAPRIIFCNGFEISGFKAWWYRRNGWLPFGKSFRHYLHAQGVPDAAIEMISCPHIHDTASEVTELTNYLQQKSLKQVLLVTSASHSRRARMVWRRLSPKIRGIMIGARDSGLQWWWSSRRGRTTVVYEYLALLKELLRHYTLT